MTLAAPETSQVHRYSVLDSYRAIAALMVVFYHYFFRWSAAHVDDPLTAYFAPLAENTIVQHGYLGVELFFIISGFVILLTLEKTDTFYKFFVKRFARLFPAMAVCSVLTFAVVTLLGVAPLSNVSLIDFIPSWTFTSPYLINKITGLDTHYISGVYWSLFIEVKFYVLAAILYYAVRKHFLSSFIVVTVCGAVVYWVSFKLQILFIANLLTTFWYPKYCFFFLSGMAYYRLTRIDIDGRRSALFILLLSIFGSFLTYSESANSLAAAIVPIVMIATFNLAFCLFVFKPQLVKIFSARWLTSIGVSSYSLYLIHESIGVSIISRLSLSGSAGLAVTFMVVGLMIIVSLGSYTLIERPIGKTIRTTMLSRIKSTSKP